MDVQRIINSSFGIDLVSTLGRLLPRWLGYRLAALIAGNVASQRDSKMVQAIRTNQWVVRGETLDGAALDLAVRETVYQSARSIFDLYHYIQNPKASRHIITLDPIVQNLLYRPEFDERGLMIVGIHTSNFDLVLQWLSRQGLKFLGLTIPNPQGGRRVEFEMRKRSGVNLIPASIGGVRQALRHLQQGGVVLTGIDRPIPEPKAWPRFFGRPAALPIHHIFMATKAHVPVMIIATNRQDDGKYHVQASELIEMEYHPDWEVEALHNAEKVLQVAEGFIRKMPQQWSISLPIWPDAMNQVPD